MMREWPALIFALVYPTLLTLVYFLLLASDGEPSTLQQFVYAAGKVIQFALPVLFVWWHDRRFPRPSKPRFAGLLPGLVFGVLVFAAALVLYHSFLKGSPTLAKAPREAQEKLREFGLTTLPAYVLFAAFYSLVHSLLEEYYWRWFVFGRLRRYLSFGPAAALASLAFMSHHVIVLSVYLPGHFWTAVAPLSLCIAVGGAVWCWLYERSGSIYSPWLSHAIVDAAIFVIGYDMLRVGW